MSISEMVGSASNPTANMLSRPEDAPAGLLVDTGRVSPEHRFTYWQSETAEVVGSTRLQQHELQPFDGQIFGYPLG
ncbi:hypothetical protein P3H15_53955, partial [Rhodococcus sp. T2V]|uniref:hypothetical protein n=1 Tax=Rhodococcus sp. T2V TaxID=3034164 RepID=UPI0023E1D792